MAKLNTQSIVITVSQLVRDNDTTITELLDSETLAAIEAVVAELVGESVLVEVVRA